MMDIKGTTSKATGGSDKAAPVVHRSPAASAPNAKIDANEFRGALEKAQAPENAQAPAPTTSATAGGPSASIAGASTATSSGLKFSAHAVERMRSRGISFTPEDMKAIDTAVAKAADKGAKDTLVISGENALVVSVKNNVVVTVMDKAVMKENVFTNIDSTVFV